MAESRMLMDMQTDLRVRLDDARRRTDEVFQVVDPAAMYDRPIPERHRIIFYLGHLEAFDRNLLHDRALTLPESPELDRLFAFGIDPVDGGLPTDQPQDWPAIKAVRSYVKQVRDAVDHELEHTSPEFAARRGFSLDQLLNVAIEHRLMHAETLAYMLHQLPLEKKQRPARTGLTISDDVLQPEVVQVPSGSATLGMPRAEGVFGWDNEFESEILHVPGFTIDRFKVTNGEYLEFVRDGGYGIESLWREADWRWIKDAGITHPAFWHRSGDEWFYRGMFEEIPLPLLWPVYVSHAEASAYAKWVGKSLPTEAQWHRAAYGTRERREDAFPWGSQAPDETRGNFDFKSWDPLPVSAHPAGRSAFGVEDLSGNGWEWTSTVFGPLPGFEPFSFYPGYSANFFDGQHYVIKGASARTASCMLRRTFRNWFQAHYQYVYAGFRCVTH
jgi:ergothioneine biosynthesis protein EgtB